MVLHCMAMLLKVIQKQEQKVFVTHSKQTPLFKQKVLMRMAEDLKMLVCHME